jgi:hypothetical protein
MDTAQDSFSARRLHYIYEGLMSNLKIQPEDPIKTGVVEHGIAAPVASSEGKHSIEQTDQISKRAHLISEQRTGDATGNAESDWLEAEREIDTATKGYQR